MWSRPARPPCTGSARARCVARWPPAPNDTQLAAAVRQLRVGDRAGSRRGNSVSPSPSSGMTDTASVLAALQQALREKRNVWVGFVDGHGTASQRYVAPLGVGGGV